MDNVQVEVPAPVAEAVIELAPEMFALVGGGSISVLLM